MKSILGKLEFTIARELVIRAPRATVFRYFTDSERWARWWGKGSTIEGTVGGALKIVYPDGTLATGEVEEIRSPERVVFRYGYEGEGKVIPPGGSRVTITLEEHPEGTQLAFLHELADAAARDLHVQGWRYQLALYANVVANEAHADTASVADRWFGAWNEPDAVRRHQAFEGLVSPEVVFRDAYSCTNGLEDLEAHVTGAKVHMPGITVHREGDPRHCQGTLLVHWIANKGDGTTLSKGTSVFELTGETRIARVVGFWG